MFTEDDLKKLKAFKAIIDSGGFEMKGNAVLMAASLFIWFNGLEKKIMDYLNPKPLELKEKKKSIRKI